MITLNLLGIAACLVLLVMGVAIASHERHPLDLLVGGALALGSLAGIAMILHLELTWHFFIMLISFGIVAAHIFGLIPERFYFDHDRR